MGRVALEADLEKQEKKTKYIYATYTGNCFNDKILKGDRLIFQSGHWSDVDFVLIRLKAFQTWYLAKLVRIEGKNRFITENFSVDCVDNSAVEIIGRLLEFRRAM